MHFCFWQLVATPLHHWWSQGSDIMSLQGLKAQPWQDCHDKRVPQKRWGPPRTGERKKKKKVSGLSSAACGPPTVFWCLKFALASLRSRVWVVGGWGRNFSKLVLIEWGEDKDPSPQSHVSIPLVAYTWTYLICMYALFNTLFWALTIENKLTFLGFIFVSSKPVERTWRRTQEVRPYSQPVNPPRWPHRPFLPFFSVFPPPPHIHLGPPVLEPPKLASFPRSFFHGTPLVFERGGHKLCQKSLAFIRPAVAHSPVYRIKICAPSPSVHLF